jgi:hypothetical protein
LSINMNILINIITAGQGPRHHRAVGA